jgi:hypothetical protein
MAVNPRVGARRGGSVPVLREFFRRRSDLGAYVIPVNKAQQCYYLQLQLRIWSALHDFNMSSIQQRKNEILAKRAKLAELKKQRELRQKEFSNNRNSIGDASEVPRPKEQFSQAQSHFD